MKKSIFFFALLLLICTQVQTYRLQASDDTEIVWLYKVQLFDKGILLKNESVIFLSGAHSVFRNAVTGQEIARYENINFNNSSIFLFNNDLNYIQASENNRKIFIYETNSFKVIDSIKNDEKELGQLFGNQRTGILYEALTDKIRVWDIVQKKVIREMFFPKYDEPDLYSNDVNASIDCNNEKIIVKHIKQFRPQGPPQFWYDVEYIAFYDAQTLDSLNAIKITGGRFSLSSNCKYFARIQGNIELYDYKSLKLVKNFTGANNEPIRTYRFSNDDKYLFITSSNNYIIQIWDLELNKLIKTFDKTTPGDILSITNDNKFAFCSVGNTFYKLRLNLDPNSIEGEQVINPINIYPNPTNDLLNINIDLSTERELNYKIYDLNSKLVDSNILLNNQIDVSNLSKGAYILEIITFQISNKIKFIKE